VVSCVVFQFLLDLTLLTHPSRAAMVKPRVLYWFRTDLRLHDSHGLGAALDLKPEALYPIWCWDSELSSW